jgi:hypothetical protein
LSLLIGFPDGLERTVLGLEISGRLHLPADTPHLHWIQPPQDVVFKIANVVIFDTITSL